MSIYDLEYALHRVADNHSALPSQHHDSGMRFIGDISMIGSCSSYWSLIGKAGSFQDTAERPPKKPQEKPLVERRALHLVSHGALRCLVPVACASRERPCRRLRLRP